MGALSDAEVVAILRGDNTRQFPAAKHATLEQVCSLQFRQEVGCVGHEHIGAAHVGGAVIQTGVGIVGACLRSYTAARVVGKDVSEGMRPSVGCPPLQSVADAAAHLNLESVVVRGSVVRPV